jgi:hypothetical protein
MKENKCVYGVPIHAIGISVNCITCDKLIKDGYCKAYGSYRIEKEYEEKKYPDVCKQCRFFTYTKISSKEFLYDGYCIKLEIGRNRLSKSCDKGLLMPHLRTKVKELEYRLGI